MLTGSLDIAVSNPQQFATAAVAKTAIAATIAETVSVPRDRVTARSIEVVAGRRLQASTSSFIRVEHEIMVPENTRTSDIMSSWESARTTNLAAFTSRLSQNLAAQGAPQEMSSSVSVLHISPLALNTTSAGSAPDDSGAVSTTAVSAPAADSEGMDPGIIGAIVGGVGGALLFGYFCWFCWSTQRAARQRRAEKEWFENQGGWSVAAETSHKVEPESSAKTGQVAPSDDDDDTAVDNGVGEGAESPRSPPTAQVEATVEGPEKAQVCACAF